MKVLRCVSILFLYRNLKKKKVLKADTGKGKGTIQQKLEAGLRNSKIRKFSRNNYYWVKDVALKS